MQHSIQSLADLQNMFSQIFAENQNLKKQNSNLLDQISNITNILLNQKAQMESKIEKYKNDIKILDSENNKLSVKINELNDNLKKANENVRKYKSYYFKYIRSIQEKNKLENAIKKLENSSMPKIEQKKIKNVTDETSFDTTDYLLFKKNNSEMFSLFIKELINNAQVSIYGRRYSDFYKSICVGIWYLNTKCYKALQKILPIPSITTLYYFSKNNLDNYKLALQSIDKSDFILNEYKNTFFKNCEFPINCSLSIDQTIGVKKPLFFHNNNTNNYLCLYYMQPINNFFPNTPIYVEFDLNGRMSKITLENAKKICETAKKFGYIIKYICTDADTPTNQWHKSIINNKYNPEIQAFDESIENIPSLSFSTDFLHALKSQKKRFFRCDLYLNYNSKYVNKYIVRLYLGKNKILMDESLQSSFKDKYALDFFSPNLLLMSLKNIETISFAYYILPFVFWHLGQRAIFIGKNDRLNIIKIAFTIFQYELQNFPKQNSKEKFASKKTKNIIKLSFYRKIDLIRYLNSLVCLGDSIKNNKGNVGTERTTSHCEENYFGNIRMELNDSLDADLFLSVMARRIIRKKIFHENGIFNVPTQKEKMKNVAGVPTFTDMKDIGINENDIINEIFIIRKYLTNEITDFSQIQTPNLIDCIRILNDKILIMSESSTYSPSNESYTSGSQLLCRFAMIKNKHYFTHSNEI